MMSVIEVAACGLIPPLVCLALGSAVGGASRLPGADMLVGAGLLGGMLTILAAVTRVPLSALMLGLALLALSVAVLRARLPGGGLTTWLALVLAAPLLVRAAATQATLWDEFWHWLPSAAYEYTHDSLARRDLPPSFSHLPAYPQAIPLAIAAASFLARRFLEGAGPVLNVALLAAFCALLADTLVAVRSREGLANRRCAHRCSSRGGFPPQSGSRRRNSARLLF